MAVMSLLLHRFVLVYLYFLSIQNYIVVENVMFVIPMLRCVALREVTNSAPSQG